MWGDRDGRFQFFSAGNAAVHGFHLRVIYGVAGIVVKEPSGLVVVIPGAEQSPAVVTGALVCNGLQCIGYHSIPLLMYSIGMVCIPLEWIPMD